MNLKDRQEKLKKAKGFINADKEGPSSKEKKGVKKSTNKIYVNWYIPAELAKKIRVQAAKNGEKPSHFIERAALKELNEEEQT